MVIRHRVIGDMCKNHYDWFVCGVFIWLKYTLIEIRFDTTDPDILLQKLEWYVVDGLGLDWFEIFWQYHKQRFRVDNITSDVTPCPIEVTQVPILGPNQICIVL